MNRVKKQKAKNSNPQSKKQLPLVTFRIPVPIYLSGLFEKTSDLDE